MTTPLLLQYVARFDGGDEIVGFDGGREIVGIGGGHCKKSRPWCSPFVSFTSRGVVDVCTRICSQEYVRKK